MLLLCCPLRLPTMPSYFVVAVVQQNKKQNKTKKMLSRVQLFATPWTAACQASLLLGYIYFCKPTELTMQKMKNKCALDSFIEQRAILSFLYNVEIGIEIRSVRKTHDLCTH